MEFDTEYPGTAVQRLKSVHERVKSLSPEQLSGDWSEVRRKLLWAGISRYRYDGHEWLFLIAQISDSYYDILHFYLGSTIF
jgi:hypothetical protein